MLSSRMLMKARQFAIIRPSSLRSWGNKVKSPPLYSKPQVLLSNHFSTTTTRHFASAIEQHVQQQQQPETADMVKQCIKKMMQQRDTADAVKPVTDDDLEHGIRHFRNLLAEAHACIQDCKEANTDENNSDSSSASSALNFEEEYQSAGKAVEETIACYINLLDDLRRANEEQTERYSDIRSTIVDKVKLLREEFATLDKGEQQ